MLKALLRIILFNRGIIFFTSRINTLCSIMLLCATKGFCFICSFMTIIIRKVLKRAGGNKKKK